MSSVPQMRPSGPRFRGTDPRFREDGGHKLEEAVMPTQQTPGTNPGDEAPPGVPGTGENICRLCRGTGRVQGRRCEECGGTGKIVEGIGGA